MLERTTELLLMHEQVILAMFGYGRQMCMDANWEPWLVNPWRSRSITYTLKRQATVSASGSLVTEMTTDPP
jgi:hypothetical protein